jgi:AI-2 transport protein TqsA
MTLSAFALSFAILALSVYLMVIGQSILLPLVIAVFFWYLIGAFAQSMDRLSLAGKQLPEKVRLAASIVTFMLIAWGLVELMAENLSGVAAAAPGYQANLQQIIAKSLGILGLQEMPSISQITSQIDFAKAVGGAVSALTGMIGSISAILLYLIFLFLEQGSFKKKLTALFPDAEQEKRVRQTLDRIGDEIQTYIWLKTLTSSLTGVISYAIMALIGLDYAAFWAVLIFVLNFIPYIGSLTGVVFPSVLALLQFSFATPFFIAAGGLTLVQIFVGNFLEPRIMGKSLNLSPLAMLLALAVWGAIWGVAGMFLSIPIMVVAMIILGHFPQTQPLAILLSQDGNIHPNQET